MGFEEVWFPPSRLALQLPDASFALFCQLMQRRCFTRFLSRLSLCRITVDRERDKGQINRVELKCSTLVGLNLFTGTLNQNPPPWILRAQVLWYPKDKAAEWRHLKRSRKLQVARSVSYLLYDERSRDSRSREHRSRDPRSRDSRSRDSRSRDHRSRDSRSRDPRSRDARSRDPRSRDPRSRDPGAETPGAETQEAETTGAETPGAETPGAETTGAETTGAETPRAETTGAETPGAETTGAETPGAETPGAETPGAETPGAETPGAETPGAETTGAETPGAETPGAETPGAETPGAETPGAETPGAETTGAETPRAIRTDSSPRSDLLKVLTGAFTSIWKGGEGLRSRLWTSRTNSQHDMEVKFTRRIQRSSDLWPWRAGTDDDDLNEQKI